MVLKEFFAKLGLEIDGGSFAKAETAFGGVNKIMMGFAGVAAAAGAALLGAALSTARQGEEARKTAQSVGVSTDALQEMQYAAKVSGLSAEDLTTGMRLLSRQMYAASQGQKEAAATFADLGVSTTGANGGLLSVQDVIEQLSDKFQSMPDGAEKTALAMKAFGRSGAAMIPMLNQGADGIAALSKEAEDLGVVLGDDTIKQSEAFHGSMVRAQSAVTGLVYSVGGPLLKSITPLLNGMAKWVAANRQIISQKIGQVVGALGKAFDVLGRALHVAWIILEPVVSFLWRTGLMFGGLGVAIRSLAGDFGEAGKVIVGVAAAVAAAWLIATSPIAVLVALLAAAFLIWQDVATGLAGGKSLIFEIFDKWGDLLESWTFGNDKDSWIVVRIKAAIGYLTHLSSLWEAFKISIGAEDVKTLEEVAGAKQGWMDSSGRLLSKDEIGQMQVTETGKSGVLNGEATHYGYQGEMTKEQYAQTNVMALVHRNQVAEGITHGAQGLFPSEYGNPGPMITNNTTFNVTQLPAEDGIAFAQRVGEIVDEANRANLRAAKASR